MRDIEVDVAHFRSPLVDHENLIVPLHEIKRVDAAHDQKSRNAPGTAACAGLEGSLARRRKLILLPHLFDRPRLEDRAGKIGNPKRHLSAMSLLGT